MKIYKKEKYNDNLFTIIDESVYVEINTEHITMYTLDKILDMMEEHDCDIFMNKFNKDVLHTIQKLAIIYIKSELGIDSSYKIQYIDTYTSIVCYNSDGEYMYSIDNYSDRVANAKLLLLYGLNAIYNVDDIGKGACIVITKPLLIYPYRTVIGYLHSSMMDECQDNKMLYDYITETVNDMHNLNRNNLFKCSMSILDKYRDKLTSVVLHMLLTEAKCKHMMNEDIISINYNFKLNDMKIPVLSGIVFNTSNGDKLIHEISDDVDQERIIDIIRLRSTSILISK